MFTGALKTQRMASALTSLDRYHEDGYEFFSHILRVTGDETRVSFVNVETKEQSKQWMHTHSPDTPRKFKQTLSLYQKADGNCLLGQERSTDGGIHTRDNNNVISVLRNTKKLHRANHNKRRVMMTSGVMLLHVNVRPHTAARTRALLEHFSWELFDLAPSDNHLFTCLKSRLRSQRFNNNEVLMEGVKSCLSSQAADFFNTGI
jgi:hypothetical protein